MSHLQTNEESNREVEEHSELQILILPFHHQYCYCELGVSPLLKLLSILLATLDGLWITGLG